ncbi:MAG TPA: glycosyltransferase family 2 protein [Sphingomicrobium sp.]
MLKPAGRPEISIVIPCYNEEENARAIAAAVIAEMEKVSSNFDVIFIDNGSADRTVPIIRDMCQHDARIRLIINTRNFGQMRSPTHGIFQGDGRAILAICADFQDPPELIPELVEKWRAGADIVLGVSKTKKVSPFFEACRKVSYSLQRRFGDYPIIPNATGFGIYDEKVVRAIAALNEPEPFFRALLVETGFNIETISFRRPARAAGKSKNNFFTLLDFALSGFAGSSKGLLRVPLYVGFFSALLTVITGFGAIVAFFFGGSVRLWVWAGAIELQFTLLFIFLGLLGVQVRLIADRTRGTPLVIERERVNFPDR